MGSFVPFPIIRFWVAGRRIMRIGTGRLIYSYTLVITGTLPIERHPTGEWGFYTQKRVRKAAIMLSYLWVLVRLGTAQHIFPILARYLTAQQPQLG